MNLPSGLPEQVDGKEDLARFLTSSNHYNSSGVKPTAFLPNPKNGETSVFRHGAEPLDSLRAIAQKEVGTDRNIHGAAIVQASVVTSIRLEVRAKEPPLRHADIVGWPWNHEDPLWGKAERKELAARIAQKAAHPVMFALSITTPDS